MKARKSQRVVVVTAAGVLAALGVIAACQSPTQIILHIRTNVQCDREAPTPVVSVGRIDRPDDEAPLASTHVDCASGGDVGTLVITPTSDEERDATTGIRVAMRYAKDLEPGRDTGDCTRASAAYCIVQRRVVRFRPHETLDLPIELNVSCKGLYCSALETCNRAAKCVSAECTDGTCEAVAASGGPEPDGGFAADGAPLFDGSVDGPSSDGAMADGAMADGNVAEAGSDASEGGTSDAGGITVAKCSLCQLTQSCCVNSMTQTARCVPVGSTCPVPEMAYDCWTKARCPGLCCGKTMANPQRFACNTAGTCNVLACSSSSDCTPPAVCVFPVQPDIPVGQCL